MSEDEPIVLVEGDSTCRNCQHDKHAGMCSHCLCREYVPTRWAIVAGAEPTSFEHEEFVCPDCGKTFYASGISFTSFDVHRELVLALHQQEDCGAWKNRLKYWKSRWQERKWEGESDAATD